VGACQCAYKLGELNRLFYEILPSKKISVILLLKETYIHMGSSFSKFDFEDLSQLIIGASVLSVPIAFTEEAWNLSRTLPIINLIVISFLSLAFISIYAFKGIYDGKVKNRIPTYILRVFFDYGVTLCVVIIVLFALNKFPILSETLIAVKRVIIISFPASMGAIVVDSFDKE